MILPASIIHYPLPPSPWGEMIYLGSAVIAAWLTYNIYIGFRDLRDLRKDPDGTDEGSRS